MHSECVAEIRAFIQGGLPGLERLRRVAPTIFRHYGVTDPQQKDAILLQAGLPSPH